eukprot:scaffold257154_cov31-Tisochrysis_lutea.AAC.1
MGDRSAIGDRLRKRARSDISMLDAAPAGPTTVGGSVVGRPPFLPLWNLRFQSLDAPQKQNDPRPSVS